MIKRILTVLFFLCFLNACTNIVRVHKGDTLYSIARRQNVSVRAIIDRNKLKPPYTLSIGQKLIIPQQRYYRVRKGDTLYSIAKKYGMTVASLARINNLKYPYTLSVGQRLLLNNVATTNNVPTTKTTAKKSNTQQKTTSTSTASKPVSIPKSAQSKRFDRPASGKIVQGFTQTESMHNDGINIAGKLGDPIKAADSGQVVYAGNELKGYGNLLLIKHKDGWITAYAHNDKLLVKKGAQVVRGQKIATMGKTGSVKTPQLHFEVRYKTKVVDPQQYLK
ncbi:MAG: LysM peptidoglycan-binding domain-containing protein [Alphaproteobacteria bacterium]|nr:LysM peptidoglycan-binding domain-containing protein [Alphaproteobacteria bacterium]